MANNEPKKNIPLSTIPTSKLTIILNNFIVNTTNHLNKLSVNVDEQLSEFDKKMNDLEIMTTLFESKLESLPEEIKSSYPPLQPCSLDDVNPTFSGNSNNNMQRSEEKQNESNQNEEIKNENKEGVIEGEGDKKDEDKKEKEGEGEKEEELSPEEDLNNFLNKYPSYFNLYRMLKLGVPYVGVSQKAQLNGFDMDLFNEMYEKAKKANKCK